jgi:glycine/D-amino acid oxidase-like deaminating enzyme
VKRRDCLKGCAALAAAAVLPGCSDENSGAAPATGSQPESTRPGAVILDENETTPLRSSGWTSPAGVLPDHPPLNGDLDADVAVVGAGLAGSSVALHLAEAGLSVVVLEARQPGWGASGRNAGHVAPTLRDVDVIRRFPDGGKAFLELFREHHQITFDLARRHGISCDAVPAGYLNATESARVFEKLKTESGFWQREQGQQVEWLEGPDMKAVTGSDYYPYGVLYRSGGRVNPYRFTNGMIAAAIRHGARVFGGTEATSLRRSGSRWRVTTPTGSVVASRVVFCTNAYPTSIVPQFANSFYPLTAYALSTQPLPREALQIVLPGGAPIAQQPVDLNPSLVDGIGRIVTASIPSTSRPQGAAWHFETHLAWIHRTWPQTRDMDIRLEHYWTGRVALRDVEFPGAFEIEPGLLGLMHFNAWGNVMAPLLGMALARALAADRLETLPFPLEKPAPVGFTGKQDLVIRRLLIPAARVGQRLGII